MQILIAGTDRTGAVDLATLTLQDAVGERSVCRFSVTDVDGTLPLARGQAVEIIHEGTKCFGGTIDRITRRRVGVRRKHYVCQVECVDWHQLCDRRIVVQSYQNQAAGAIVQDLLTAYLAGDGVAADGALYFDGVDDYVSVPDANSLDMSGSMTVEVRFRCDGQPDAGDALVSKSGNYILLFPAADGRVRFADTLGHYFETYGITWDSNYHWVTGRYDAFSGAIRVFVDGAVPNGYQAGSWAGAPSTNALLFGINSTYFKGVIAEIRLWNRALTDEEAGSPGRAVSPQSDGLVGWWRFNEGSGTQLRDSTANANHGTIYGATWVEQTVQPGPTVTEAVFNYVPLTRALDSLAEFAGYAWWIDAEKRLYCVPRETYAAPWDLTDDRANDIEIDEGREGYRNRQYIKAGTDMTDPQTETRKGDGNTKAFAMGFPLAKVPTVKVNGVIKTVGIKGVDTGKDWYWSKGDPVIVQDQAATPLTASDTLEVTYQGLFNVVALSEDPAAIEERKSVEGGTGIYEAVADEPHLSTRQAAFESAAAKLRRYAKLARTITFNTVYTGLRPGQLLTVYLPDRGIDGEQYLIEETNLEYIAGDKWLWRVKAVSGEALGGWVKFFKDLANKQIAIRENISENQVLTVLVSAGSETWRWTESQTVTVWACPVPSTTLYPSPTLYPC